MSKSEEYFCYFAYGSNLLTERVRVSNPTACFIGNGVLRNFEFCFGRESKTWKGATATIHEKEGSFVIGVVYKIAWSDSKSLDIQEGSYNRIMVEVELDQSETGRVTCRTYITPRDLMQKLTGLRKPSQHYKAVILTGAKEHNFPSDYVAFLDRFETNDFQGSVPFDFGCLKELNK